MLDTLWRRLVNLTDRGLVVHESPRYRITEAGKTYAATFSNELPLEAQVPSQPQAKVTFNDAVEHVLDQFADQNPMHYKVIAERIRQLGLVETAGKTPEATLYSQIMSEIIRSDSVVIHHAS